MALGYFGFTLYLGIIMEILNMFGCDLNKLPMLSKSKSCEPRFKGMDSVEGLFVRSETGVLMDSGALSGDFECKLQEFDGCRDGADQGMGVFGIGEKDNQGSEAVFQAGLENLPFFEENSFEPYAILCRICFKNSVKFVTLNCSHSFCASCTHLYFISLIESFKLKSSDWHCPECQFLIDKSEFYKHLKPEDLLRLKTLKLKQKGMLLVSQHAAIFCPRLNCPGFGYIFPDQDTTACVHCKCTLCLLCNSEFHPFTICDLPLSDESDEEFNNLLLSNGWKRCPNCAVPIEKTEGCQFITCHSPVCNGEFHLCNICGKSLTLDYHFGHFITQGVFGEVCNTLENLADIIDS